MRAGPLSRCSYARPCLPRAVASLTVDRGRRVRARVVSQLQTLARRNQPGAEVPLHLRVGHSRAGVGQLFLVRPEDREPGAEPDDSDGPDDRQPSLCMDFHVKELGNSNFESILEVLSGDFKPLKKDFPTTRRRSSIPTSSRMTARRALTSSSATRSPTFLQTPERPGSPAARRQTRETIGLPKWRQQYTNGKKEYQYIQAVYFKRLPDGLSRQGRNGGRRPHRQSPHAGRRPTASTGSRPRRATWPAPSWSLCRWSRRSRRST